MLKCSGDRQQMIWFKEHGVVIPPILAVDGTKPTIGFDDVIKSNCLGRSSSMKKKYPALWNHNILWPTIFCLSSITCVSACFPVHLFVYIPVCLFYSMSLNRLSYTSICLRYFLVHISVSAHLSVCFLVHLSVSFYTCLLSFLHICPGS